MARPSDLNYSMNITIAENLGAVAVQAGDAGCRQLMQDAARCCALNTCLGWRPGPATLPSWLGSGRRKPSVVVLEHNLRCSFFTLSFNLVLRKVAG